MDSPPNKTNKLPAVTSAGNGGVTSSGGNVLRSSSSGKNTHKKLAPLEGNKDKTTININFTIKHYSDQLYDVYYEIYYLYRYESTL